MPFLSIITSKMGIVLAVAAIVAGMYFYIQVLENKYDAALSKIEIVEKNIETQKQQFQEIEKTIKFNAKIETQKKSIEKEIKRDESNSNDINSLRIYL